MKNFKGVKTKIGRKTTVCIFQATNEQNLPQENLDAVKRNLERETKSLLIAAQNNAIRTNHIKARIDKIQQNSKCSLYVLHSHDMATCNVHRMFIYR